MKRTVVTAFYNQNHRRLKLPHALRSSNPNAAVMRCHWHMMVNTYGAHYAEVYDLETAEVFVQYRITYVKGDREVRTAYKADPRRHGDPIRRTSAHALFHDLEIEDAI